MNLRDPKTQKILMVAVGLVTIGYVYFFTSFLPINYPVRKARIKALEQEYAKLDADLEKARQMVGKLAQLEAEYAKLHDQWVAAQQLLPQETEMPDLLRKVTTAGNRAGVEFMLFQPQPVIVKEEYKEHPVRIQVRGGYHQLGIFLSRLANLERIVNVSQLDIKTASKASKKKGGSKKDDENDGNSVIAQFTLTAHTLIGGLENASVANPAQQ